MGAITVADVAARLGVSDMTVRRDLDDLEREGRLARTHGGAVSKAATPERQAPRVYHTFAEPTFEARLNKNAAAKRAIAAAAASAAQGARAIALDVGTTTYLLASLLVEWRQAKVFTNSLRIAARLGEGRGGSLSAGRPAAGRRDVDLRPLGDRAIRGAMVRHGVHRRLRSHRRGHV